MSGIEDDIAKLAQHVAKKAAQSETTLQESTDALKALTTYYGVLKKRGDLDEGGETEPSLATLTRDIEEHANGDRAAVRGRRGARGTTQ